MGCGNLLERQLGVANDDTEHVVEVVGDATRQPPDGFHFLCLKKLPLEPFAFHLGLLARRDVRQHGKGTGKAPLVIEGGPRRYRAPNPAAVRSPKTCFIALAMPRCPLDHALLMDGQVFGKQEALEKTSLELLALSSQSEHSGRGGTAAPPYTRARRQTSQPDLSAGQGAEGAAARPSGSRTCVATSVSPGVLGS